jgi:uncharacterized protein
MERTEASVAECTILRGLVGSTIWGLNVADGLEDRDEMGVCIEPLEWIVGFQGFEQFIYRSAVEREGKHNARSKAGDLDLCIYSLRKYVRLALKGNPSMIALLFVPEDQLVTLTESGRDLQKMAPLFVSRRCAQSCLMYMRAQRDRLLGTRGQMRSNRPELIEKYGFNTKYAMHMLRLGYQGIEFMKTGRLQMPMADAEREFLLDVRQGRVTQADALAVATRLDEELQNLLTDASAVPRDPNVKAIEDWMVSKYRHEFEEPFR